MMMHRLRCDRGQAVVLAAFMLFVFGLFSAISVDVGLFMVDRRDGQNDVDKAALAGALELTLNNSSAAADAAAAEAAALEWATKNGIVGSDPGVTLTINAISSCYSADDGVPTGVTVSLVRPPNAFFLGFVDRVTPVTDWNIHATATACAGRPVEMTGMLPFAISEVNDDCFTGPDSAREPRLGEACELVVDTSYQGSVGFLSIDANGDGCEDAGSGANELGTNVLVGIRVNCAVGDLVSSKQGASVGQILTGIQDRMLGAAGGLPDGECENSLSSDSNFLAGNNALFNLVGWPSDLYGVDSANPSRGDNMDDFFEVWAYDSSAAHPAEGLQPYDCSTASGLQTSPRNATVIIVHDYANPEYNANQYVVRGFARIYIEGCTRSTGAYEKDCLWSGGGSQRFTIHARFVEQVGLTSSNLGLDTTYGDVEVFLKQ